MPIRACPACSSDRLVFPKDATTYSCEDCGWSGIPNEFASWNAWQEFRLATRAKLVA
jgi:hypothetical protein